MGPRRQAGRRRPHQGGVQQPGREDQAGQGVVEELRRSSQLKESLKLRRISTANISRNKICDVTSFNIL